MTRLNYSLDMRRYVWQLRIERRIRAGVQLLLALAATALACGIAAFIYMHA